MRRVIVVSCAVLLAACSSESAPASEAPPNAVAPGKADDFFSNVAAEFTFASEITLVFSAAEWGDPATRQRRIDARLSTFGLYLSGLLARAASVEAEHLGVTARPTARLRRSSVVPTWSSPMVQPSGVVEERFGFAFEVGGPRELRRALAALPGATTDGTRVDVPMAFPSLSPAQSVEPTREEIAAFDPETYSGSTDILRFGVHQLASPANAFPHFAEFIDDDVLDATIVLGWDDSELRVDLVQGERIFEHLETLGFVAPAPAFGALTPSTPPFAMQARARGGRSVRVEVRLLHAQMFADPAELRSMVLRELGARDVFLYDGHAGPGAGFWLSPDPASDIAPAAFAEAPLTSKQQLVVVQGCQGYADYADALYEHSAKDESNLDVIAAVNTAYGRGTLGLLSDLFAFDRQGHHVPSDYLQVLSNLNRDELNEGLAVLYGVFGIASNPQLHPYAVTERIGRECEAARDCGDTSGNACVRVVAGQPRTCGVVALSPEACPEGSSFVFLERAGVLTGGACL